MPPGEMASWRGLAFADLARNLNGFAKALPDIEALEEHEADNQQGRGQYDPKRPQQDPERQHPEQTQDGRQIHRSALNEGKDQIALDLLHGDIDKDRPEHHGWALDRKSTRLNSSH